ncbi:MAG: hypothetical protein ACKVHE_16465 [Planctomycetales bacterium]
MVDARIALMEMQARLKYIGLAAEVTIKDIVSPTYGQVDFGTQPGCLCAEGPGCLTNRLR